MRSRRIFVLILLTLPLTLCGQQVVTVIDASSGEPLPGVTMGNGALLIVSDDSGAFSVPEAYQGSMVTIRHLGYRTKELKIGPALTTIRMVPDYMLLETVTVNAYQSARPIKEVAGSYSHITLDRVATLGATGMVNEVNALPGIRMEMRSPGSYRINIRGSTLRSPFGVRNVKLYFNDIPITEPTGNTPLNVLDLEHLSSMSVIRAPASSLYGAGTGGVIFINRSAEEEDGVHGLVEGAAGSFGYGMWHTALQKRTGENYVRVMAGGVNTEGYRDHTEMRRNNLGLQGEVRVNEDQKFSYLFLYNDLFYQLPGGLTREQRDEDPTQARQIAVERNSTLDQKYLIAGVSHDWEWNEGSGNKTSVFYTQANKKNPFITNYEFEDLSGGGIRTSFFHTIRAGAGRLKLTGGGEWQWGRFQANNFGNQGGNPDTLRYVDDTKMFAGFEFFQAEYDQGPWHLTAGISFNHLIYRFNRVQDVALDSSYSVDRSFDMRISPRLGIAREFDNFSLFLNASWGFSPPTQDEVRTSDGVINTSLEAEEAISFEAGIRSDLLPGWLTGDLTLFHIRQQNTIVSQVDEEGNSVFVNSGETRHQGIELLLTGTILRREVGFVRQITARGSVSLNDLIFLEYFKARGEANADYSGNELTGGIPITYFLEGNVGLSRRLTWSVSHQFTDRIPLNDANTVYSRPYHLVRTRIEKEFANGDTRITVYIGVDNLLNERYSLGNDLNAFGDRYFNPSPERNYYGGVRIGF